MQTTDSQLPTSRCLFAKSRWIAWHPRPEEASNPVNHNTALRKRQLVGRKLIQPARAGKPIQQSAVKVPPVVVRGHQVSISASGNGIAITQTATAEEDGAVGDWIRVRPEGGSKVVRGLVTSSGEVKLSLGGGR